MIYLEALNGILAAAGLTCFRLFLPSFLLSVVLHLHQTHGWLNTSALHRLSESAPGWFTHPVAVAVLGLLAILEFLAQRDPNLRKLLMEDLATYARPLLTFLLVFGFLTPARAQEAQTWIPGLGSGQGLATTLAVLGGSLAGGINFLLGNALSGIHRVLSDLDEDNDFGLQTVVNLTQESFVLLALLATLASLFLGALLALAVLAALLLAGHLAARREARKTHPCPSCGTAIPDAALLCRACGVSQASVFGIGVFGQTSKRPVPEASRNDHAWSLLEHRRCPDCASPLEPAFASPCPTCGREPWSAERTPHGYVSRLEQRHSWIALVLVSLVPILGWAVVSLWTHFRLVRPLRIHLDWGRRFLDRYVALLLRLPVRLILLVLSAIPGISALLALVAWLRYRSARRRFLDLAQSRGHEAPPALN